MPPRDIQSGKMPSISAISLKPGTKTPGGSADLLPGQPGEDMPEGESTAASFSCPGCGMKLNVEVADEETGEGELR